MNLYRRLIENWERRLTLKDRNRKIFPFQWGVEWIASNGAPVGEEPLEFLKNEARDALEDSDHFFGLHPIPDWKLENGLLRFASPLPGHDVENNTVYARLFQARSKRRAVVVVPQWNADAESHVILCRILQRLGITALRHCLPYHEARRAGGAPRADFMVSPNVGRTLYATRQAVLEVRQLAGWLRRQGYERVGVVGTSIGSCVTYLAFVHDPEIQAGVFNHVSSFFADVVWTGLSTRYVRWGLEGHVELEDLRLCWAPISPWYFVRRLRGDERFHLLITARHDLTFRPELAEKVFEQYRVHGIRCHHVELPCGHYTTARFPFKLVDGWHICRFLQTHL